MAVYKEGVRAGEELSRGQWNLASRTPTFREFQFLPTPPPMEPRFTAPPWLEGGLDAVNARLHIPLDSELPSLMKEPPKDALMTARDRFGNFRSFVKKKYGECRNNRGILLGWVCPDSFEVGASEDQYLGELLPTKNDPAEFFVRDNTDEVVAYANLDRGLLRDRDQNVVAAISRDGVCTGRDSAFLGQFDGFSSAHLKTVVLYLTLLDPGMLTEDDGRIRF
mmetsp:Transcript_10391/g.31346  ORF Transcript_10391/g.31346 Transcript_10391/m.31346 type:complete len:222 (-) Transcript_10391:235-900(-)